MVSYLGLAKNAPGNQPVFCILFFAKAKKTVPTGKSLFNGKINRRGFHWQVFLAEQPKPHDQKR